MRPSIPAVPALLTGLGLILLASPAGAQLGNVAPLGTASMSSNWGASSTPQGAVDGNFSTHWLSGSMAHTSAAVDSWWRVDLDQAHELRAVRIHCRSDCCAERNSNWHLGVELGGVEVWSTDLATGGVFFPLGHVETVPLPAGLVGDAVRIQVLGTNLEGNGYLMLPEVEVLAETLGTTTPCVGNPNSSGQVAQLVVHGSAVVADQDLALLAVGVPTGEFGYFLASQATGQVQPAGSAGVYCLSTPVARFNQQIQTAPTPSGSFGIQVDTTQVPLTPAVAIQPGETWHFQCWFRDGTTSNFSSAVSVVFS